MPRRFFSSLVITCFVFFLAATAFADFTGRGVGVTDGDAIKVLHDGKGSTP